jgi:hypothetical protein
MIQRSRKLAGVEGHLRPGEAGRGGPVFDSAYVSRVIPLGPADAVEATDVWYRQLAPAPGGRLVGGQQLRLRPRFEPTDFDPLLLRRFRGTLWVGRWWPVRIELELAQYSRFASEIALRPTSLRWPVGIEHYGADAARAVEEIVSVITGLRVVPEQRSTRTSDVRCRTRGVVVTPRLSEATEYLAHG